jgi:hypothetical protein
MICNVRVRVDGRKLTFGSPRSLRNSRTLSRALALQQSREPNRIRPPPPPSYVLTLTLEEVLSVYAHDAGSRASHDDNGVQADELHAIRKMPSLASLIASVPHLRRVTFSL